MSLFRPEAVQATRGRLCGDINLALPLSWQLMGYLLGITIAVAGTFLAAATYTRIVTVPGFIAAADGLAEIVATRPGVITSVHIADGDIANKGSALVSIHSGERDSGGKDPEEQIANALKRQSVSIEAQSRAIVSATEQETRRLREETRALEQDNRSIQEQIALQRILIDSTQRDLERVRTMASRGFLSLGDMQHREETLISRRQHLSLLQQVRSEKATAAVKARYALTKLQDEMRIALAKLDTDRAALTREAASLNGPRAYTLVAPFKGRVTALAVRAGQPARPGDVMLIIVPESARLRAELYVPSNSIGFIAAGQSVRLAVDAFPYQRYGTITAQISEVSTAPAASARNAVTPQSRYLVAAELSSASAVSFAGGIPLRPGMILSARITTDRQSLLQWLFQPVLSLRQQ